MASLGGRRFTAVFVTLLALGIAASRDRRRRHRAPRGRRPGGNRAGEHPRAGAGARGAADARLRARRQAPRPAALSGGRPGGA